jgi:hypothetical protein
MVQYNTLLLCILFILIVLYLDDASYQSKCEYGD